MEIKKNNEENCGCCNFEIFSQFLSYRIIYIAGYNFVLGPITLMRLFSQFLTVFINLKILINTCNF